MDRGIVTASAERVEALVVGGGQAGLAMSEHLSGAGVPHLVLERHRIAERWRSERWDSLVANGPAWHDRFPGLEFSDVGPDDFASKDRVADYFAEYAEQIAAPIRCGVEVLSVRRATGRPGFRAETSAGTIDATLRGRRDRAVPAPGDPGDRSRGCRAGAAPLDRRTATPASCRRARCWWSARGRPERRSPTSCCARDGRVFLSVGPHDRPPRRYRGRDFVWWLGVLGKWDAETPPPGADHVTIAVSGANGGHTVDFRELAARGMMLVGRTASFGDGVMRFAPDLADNIAKGDANYLSLLDEADAYVARNGLDLPDEPEARHDRPDLRPASPIRCSSSTWPRPA